MINIKTLYGEIEVRIIHSGVDNQILAELVIKDPNKLSHRIHYLNEAQVGVLNRALTAIDWRTLYE